MKKLRKRTYILIHQVRMKNVTMIELYGVMKKICITFKFQNETYVSMNHLFVHLIMASNYSRRIQN